MSTAEDTDAVVQPKEMRPVKGESIEERAERYLDELVSHRGGSKREPQVRLARGLARHHESGVPLIVQAPTGVGKSYAAIAAARASGMQTIVSTHTHALQQQMEADAIMLAEATGGFSVAVLKGRSNYYCRLKGSQVRSNYKDANETPEGEEADILDWSDETATGDKGELDWAVSAERWREFSVTSEQCAGKACPFYKNCFAEQAKENASKADLVITNHAIIAQACKMDTSWMDTFPNIIFDECHELAAVVGEAFGATITDSRLGWALSQARSVSTEKDKKAWNAAVSKIQSATTKEPLRHLNGTPVADAIASLASIATSWVAALDNENSKNFIVKRALSSIASELILVSKGDTKAYTAWVEKRDEDGFMLRSVMFNPGSVIASNIVDNHHSVVFMSATVRTGDTFNPAAARFGLLSREWVGAEIPHIFDYANNGLIWLPGRMKMPSDPGYLSQVSMVAKAAIEAAQGRTLILCTSWAGVNTVGEALRSMLSKDEHPVIMQRPGVNMKTLAAQFREDPHSVLIGTRTLWTGISFEGSTCACVIVDKVPFPSPADPIIAARCEDVEDSGGNAFGAVMVPEAILTLTQGAGRMIRTVTDQGVLVLADPRLDPTSPHYKRSYATRLMRSLPPMSVTNDTQVALAKLRQINADATTGERGDD